jgi:uncharacterized protein (DUF3820 family)
MDPLFADRMAADLAAIARMRMPFGKYGPDHFPPRGIPIYDLPAEYLQWFAQRGWPRDELGRLLEIVYQMKADGSDSAFDPIRRAAGGRVPLRKPRERGNYEL